MKDQEKKGENTKEENIENHQDIKDDSSSIIHISGMYKDWFLDYASYVILERAVPHVYDGLKPVHRRILHAMKRLDDGRYNKVANIIGHTMQFHPHGDASIGDALVQLGQKDLLVDTQGNWGNILTGDSAAAPRYIEARLSKFALEVVFNPKTTFWKASYDGRNKEPIALPVKFPLLLAQGVEGIAVGLSSKILPHNFNELIDASICILKDKEYEIYPDFPGGGYADCSRYNNGLRGGKVRIRAKIEKNDKKTLVIKELPYGKTTTSLIDSIISANDKGKIKIKKIDDNTAEEVEILIHLNAGVSPDKTIDALYAFNDCEISISPNACVIEEDKPHFLNVKEILEIATNNTVNLLRRELEIRKGELEENWHFLSLEKIFIDNKIYRDIEEAETHEDSVKIIHKKLKPHTKNLKREVTDDDVVRLMDIPIRRIIKFDRFKAEENLRAIEEEIKDIEHKIANIIDFTINYYKEIKKKYGKGKERKTELRSFDNIIATKVVATNEKLYVDKKEGFFGTGLKKEEYVCDCSDIDDIIVFLRNGKYMVTKVSEKSFAGKDIIHIAVFKKNDKRTIYHTVYRDGKYGKVYIKRFAVTSITRDKEYDVTKGTDNSKILYFSANPNGEAEVLKVYLKPRPKLRKLIFEYDIAELAIKGRNSQGNLLSRHEVHKVVMKEKGVSTLGGRKIWFDDAVFRLNTEERGRFLGTFSGTDKILVVTKSGYFRTTSYELANHYEDDIVYIEKLNDNKIFTAVYYEADQNYIYIKRFQVEDSEKEQSFIGSNEDSKLILITKHPKPLLELEFGGKHREKENETIITE
ncbi:MAG: DNA topoisomerase IV, partial [Marinilabiliales bacterium]